MTDIEIFILIAIIALVQASFQLSVSLLTLLSGHALGKKTAHLRLLRLMSGFIGGAITMTALLLTFTSAVITVAFPRETPLIAWAIICGIMLGIGVAVWIFYYRRQSGTALWIPRSFATYLSERTRATKNTAESFGLGMSSVVGELIFCIAPILAVSTLLLHLPPTYQLIGIVLYTLIASAPQLAVAVLVGGGHSISKIQKWREQHKSFLQFIAGSLLIASGIYLYVTIVVSTAATQGVV